MRKFPIPIHLAYLSLGSFSMQKMLKIGINTEYEHEFLDRWYQNIPEGMHPVDAFLRVDRRTWLPDLALALADRFSMAHSLELRVPLLDVDVCAFADTVSIYRKVNPLRGKIILRSEYKAHLPEFLFAQPKRGWFAPGSKWLRDPVIHNLVREVFSSSYYDGLSSIFDWTEVRQMLEEHVAEKGYYRQPLWNIMALQIWARKHTIRF